MIRRITYLSFSWYGRKFWHLQQYRKLLKIRTTELIEQTLQTFTLNIIIREFVKVNTRLGEARLMYRETGAWNKTARNRVENHELVKAGNVKKCVMASPRLTERDETLRNILPLVLDSFLRICMTLGTDCSKNSAICRASIAETLNHHTNETHCKSFAET